MIYNTDLVVQGTGRDMAPVPEMQSLSERYHFEFKADEKGDALNSVHWTWPLRWKKRRMAVKTYNDFPEGVLTLQPVALGLRHRPCFKICQCGQARAIFLTYSREFQSQSAAGRKPMVFR